MNLTERIQMFEATADQATRFSIERFADPVMAAYEGGRSAAYAHAAKMLRQDLEAGQ